MNLPQYWKRDITYILLFSFFYFSVFFLLNTGKTFRLDSDYDMLFSYYSFIPDYIQTHGILPRIHPYAGLGLPLAGDPGISYYNPLFLIPLLLFGMIPATYLYIFLMFLLSGICMWIFLSTRKLNRTTVIWGSLLYISSGALAARFASGHIIFFLTYPFWPLVFLQLLKLSSNRLINISITSLFHSILPVSLLAGYFFLSGDIYGVWFVGIFFSITQLYKVIRYKPIHSSLIFQIVVSFIIFFSCFLLISSPKLYFVLKDALPIFDRTFTGNPAEGSIHLWWTILPFIVPFKVSFYDRPFFQQHIGFYFNWYEYYTFVSPLPFLFFIPVIKRLLQKQKNMDNEFFNSSSLLILLFLTGLVYVSLAYQYSPFYWVFKYIPQLHILRVPQRMYLPLSSLLIVLFCFSAHFVMNLSRNRPIQRFFIYCIFVFSLAWTGAASLNALGFAMELPRTREKEMVEWLRKTDRGSYFVLDRICCNQTFLTHAKMAVINFYAGWTPKGTPSFTDIEKLHTVRPTYIFATAAEDFSSYTYQKIYQNDIGTIWKTQNPTIFPI